jgi:hypothetical protein
MAGAMSDFVSGMRVSNLSVSPSIMTVSQQMMGACFMSVESAMITMLTTSIVSDVPGDHAENHVSEAQH